MRPFKVSVHVIEPTILFTNINSPENLKKAFYATWDRLDQAIKDEYREEYVKESEFTNFTSAIDFSAL